MPICCMSATKRLWGTKNMKRIQYMIMNGFGFSGYRSFPEDLIKIAPLNKINILIGKNNIGKSNIVNYLKYHYNYFLSKAKKERIERGKFNFSEKDIPKNAKTIEYKVSFPLIEHEIGPYLERLLPGDDKVGYRKFAKKIVTSPAFMNDDGLLWFSYKSSHFTGDFELEFDFKDVFELLQPREWNGLWSALTRQSGGSLEQHWIPETIRYLAYIPTTPIEVEVIPAIRKIGSAGSTAVDFSGEGIIDRLAKIQNPSIIEQDHKIKFHEINEFVKNVLENSSSNIEIPYERDMILVHMDGKTLPLEDLGTGVHEVVIIAAASTILTKKILCIEEPELHLHPILQQKLVNYLSECTDNQYIFTTHSAHLLNIPNTSVFHVKSKENHSYVQSALSAKDKSKICMDLGYKASDILQSNCIIWVEGPSDRIYVNYWLRNKCPELTEGVHYSIMFFGGRLFSHLTAMDYDEFKDEIEDFICLRSLNRNSVIIFDSDKSSSHSRLNDTKKRLRDEFNNGPGFAWISKGREIENYLKEDLLEESIKSAHPGSAGIAKKGQWENLLKHIKNGKVKIANKVKVARHYADNYQCSYDMLDLNLNIIRLIKFINSCN